MVHSKGYKDTKTAVDTKDILTWKEFKKDKEINVVKVQSQTKLINKTGVICFLQSGHKCNEDFLLFFKDNFRVDYRNTLLAKTYFLYKLTN